MFKQVLNPNFVCKLGLYTNDLTKQALDALHEAVFNPWDCKTYNHSQDAESLAINQSGSVFTIVRYNSNLTL